MGGGQFIKIDYENLTQDYLTKTAHKILEAN